MWNKRSKGKSCRDHWSQFLQDSLSSWSLLEMTGRVPGGVRSRAAVEWSIVWARSSTAVVFWFCRSSQGLESCSWDREQQFGLFLFQGSVTYRLQSWPGVESCRLRQRRGAAFLLLGGGLFLGKAPAPPELWIAAYGSEAVLSCHANASPFLLPLQCALPFKCPAAVREARSQPTADCCWLAPLAAAQDSQKAARGSFHVLVSWVREG